MDSQQLRTAEEEIRRLIRFELKRLNPDQRKALLTSINSYNVHLLLSRRELSSIYQNLYETPSQYGISFLFDFTVKLNYLLKRLLDSLPSFLQQAIAASYRDLWSKSTQEYDDTISPFAHQQQTSYSFDDILELMVDEKWIFGLMIFILYNEELPE